LVWGRDHYNLGNFLRSLTTPEAIARLE